MKLIFAGKMLIDEENTLEFLKEKRTQGPAIIFLVDKEIKNR